jgi:small subunit ribosomal protein S4
LARLLGPRVREMRALGVQLPGLSRKTIERRPYPPGQHGLRRAPRKPSSFKRQLQEKQKLRLNYGLTERQLRNLMKLARRQSTRTDAALVELLERRLDNVVFRAGFAPTIPAARQLVRHGHMLIDGQRVDIPSYRVDVGEVITLRPSSQKVMTVLSSWELPSLMRPPWLDVDISAMNVRVAARPGLDSLPFPAFPQLVVEYYARRL